MSAALFVVFEGPDGSGKSTALKAVAERFRARGYAVVETREPGGCPSAEAIRSLLMREDIGEAPVLSQLLLMTAARTAHLQQTVDPALEAGKLVLCDRYVDSTHVYQCAFGGVDSTVLDKLNELLQIRKPELRLFFTLDATTASARMQARGESNRFDEHDPMQWQLIADAYQQRAQVEEQTATQVDATLSPAEVAALCERVIQSRLEEGHHE